MGIDLSQYNAAAGHHTRTITIPAALFCGRPNIDQFFNAVLTEGLHALAIAAPQRHANQC